MARILIRSIHTLVTMGEVERISRNVDVLIENDRIAAVGRNMMEGAASAAPRRSGSSAVQAEDIRILDATNCVVYPGFVNCHHHLYQTLTRNIPKVQNAKLFDWLIGLYEVWRELSEEAVEVSTRVGVGELLLSGCTTTSDHFYVFPKKASRELLDVEIETARKIGVSNAAIWRWISGTAKPYGDNRRRLCDFMVKELPPAEAEEFLASLSAAILDMPSHTAVVRQ